MIINKNTSFYLGLIGGTIGFIYTFIALFSGTADEATLGETFASGMAMVAMSFSTIAIVAAVLVKQRPLLAGWLLIVSGIAIPLSIGSFGILPFLFTSTGGAISLLIARKGN